MTRKQCLDPLIPSRKFAKGPMVLISLLSFAALAVATASENASRDVVSKWQLFGSMFGLHYKTNSPSEPQKLLVIGANFGRTGTQSFVEAMRRLGLKCYHFKDGVFETPGHFDVWDDVILDDENPDKISALMDKMAEDGFNATSDMPAFVLYKEFFDRYPDARVVVTVRPNNDVKGFAKSFMDTIVPIYQLSKEVPYRYFKIFQTFTRMHEWAILKYGVPLDPLTRLPDPKDLATAHDRWIEKVKSSIPAEKMLIYSYADGWEPLCEFLSPLATSVLQNCEAIVASGESYPYLNDGSAMKAVIAFMRGITFITKAIPVLFALCICGLLVRLRTKQKGKED